MTNEQIKRGQKVVWELDSIDFRNAVREGDDTAQSALNVEVSIALSRLLNTFECDDFCNDEMEEQLTEYVIEKIEGLADDDANAEAERNDEAAANDIDRAVEQQPGHPASPEAAAVQEHVKKVKAGK